MSETALMKQIQLLVSKLGHRVWRNNSGYLQAKNGQWVKFGIANPGGSDLIGFSKDGKFLAIEIKFNTGIASTDQINFIDAVNKAGGIGFIARSTTDVIDKLS